MCRVDDISLTGALISMPVDALPVNRPSGERMLEIRLGESTYNLRAAERSRRLDEGQMSIGVEFLGGQENEQARLALALFSSQFLVHIHSEPAAEDELAGLDRGSVGDRDLQGISAG